MLSSVLLEHNRRQAEKKDEIERKKSEAMAAVNELTHHLVDNLNEGFVVFLVQ